MVLEWITRLSHNDGLTVVLTTHHPHHALAVADETLLMLGGDDFACGSSDSVLTQENLSSLYGVPLKRLSYGHGGIAVETLVSVMHPFKDCAGRIFT